MTDIVDTVTRSRMMSGIRSKNTKPEITVRRSLHAAGFRFRIHNRRLPGTPDIVLAKFRAVIFVSGCFWHGHDCPLYRLPATRTEFWRQKIEVNRRNDRRARLALAASGWRHATVWECTFRGSTRLDPDAAIKTLSNWIRSDYPELSLRGLP